MPQPISPPSTEKLAVKNAICHHRFGAAYTQAAISGSVGIGIMIDSRAEKNKAPFALPDY